MVLSKEEREALEKKIRMKMRERLANNTTKPSLPWVSPQSNSQQNSSQQEDLKNELESLKKENEELKKKIPPL